MRDETMNMPKQSDQGENIKREITKYARFWGWFLVSILIALLVGHLYLRYTPRIYQSTAKIQILNKTKGLEMPSAAFIFSRSSINLENETEILKSYRIIWQVVNNLNLTIEYYEKGNVLTSEIDGFPFKILKTIDNEAIIGNQIYTIEVKKDAFEIFKGSSDKPVIIPNFNSYIIKHNLPFELKMTDPNTISATKGKTFILRLLNLHDATNRLKGGISLSALGKSSDLLQIGYKSESRTKSERVLNELIAVFNEDGVRDRQEVSKRTINFIDERFVSLAQELDSIEVEKKDYKRSNNMVSVETDAALGLQKQTESEIQVFEVENQLLLSDMLKKSLSAETTDNDLLPANMGLADGNVNGLIDQYNTLIFERDALKVSAGDNNPNVKIVNEKIKSLQENINASLKSYKDQLKASKGQFEARNRMFSSQVSGIPLKEKIMRSIERQQTIKESLYLFLLQKKEEAAINLAITEPSIKVVEYALSSTVPVSTTPKTVYMMAIIGGFLVPFGVLYLLLLLDTKVKSKHDIELKVPNVPVIAELPKIKDQDLVFRDPNERSVQAEAFRILSSNVNYLLINNKSDKGKVIYCTSTIKGEGKTYVGINLSLALASINKKVLLIGADLRNPQIHNYTEDSKDKAGLSNYLHDKSFDWKQAVIQGFENYPKHDILLSGSIPPNPTQLLTNGRFETLLNEAKDHYDYIIVDTAPTILVTDTMLISEFADATLYLVRSGFTEKGLLEFSKNLNNTKRLKNMAYVINGVGASKAYGYTYNYGYSYGYGAKT